MTTSTFGSIATLVNIIGFVARNAGSLNRFEMVFLMAGVACNADVRASQGKARAAMIEFCRTPATVTVARPAVFSEQPFMDIVGLMTVDTLRRRISMLGVSGVTVAACEH